MKNKKALFSLMCTAVIIASGCSAGDGVVSSTTTSAADKPGTTITTEETSQIVTTTTGAVTETSVTTETSSETEVTEAPVVADDNSLAELRGEMSDEKGFAVSYFGYAFDVAGNGIYDFINESVPSFSEKYPFVTSIPEERVIGDGYGDLFCIVPRDEAATVAVNRVVLDEEGNPYYENVVYRSESGEPVLVYCNVSGYEPDTQVNVIDSQGNIFTWYPQLDDTLCVTQLYADYNEFIYDFTEYEEWLMNKYSLCREDGWIIPEREQLIGSCWTEEEYLLDGRVMKYYFEIHENTIYVEWNDGIDVEDHIYTNAEWELYNDGEIALMTINFNEFAGKLTYAVALNEDSQRLYTSVDFTEDGVNSHWLRLYRFLDRVNG